jgi:hypothetical protein
MTTYDELGMNDDYVLCDDCGYASEAQERAVCRSHWETLDLDILRMLSTVCLECKVLVKHCRPNCCAVLVAWYAILQSPYKFLRLRVVTFRMRCP